MVRLIEAEDAHFAWLLGKAGPPAALTLPPGGLEAPPVLGWLRKNANLDPPLTSWLIVAGNEVVGSVSFKSAPDAEGLAEIGYGVSPERRRLGHATAGIAQVVQMAAADPSLRGLTAETAADNVASQRVLERNGFVQTGHRIDSEDGEVIGWRLAL